MRPSFQYFDMAGCRYCSDTMRTSGNSILITGGATGIGFAIAEAFSKSDNKVLICGRREEKLKQARGKIRGLKTLKCDISSNEGLESLHEFVNNEFHELNIVINNAGIQRQIDFRKGTADLIGGGDEIDVNLKAQIYLTARFIPMLAGSPEAAIVNVSSGLGFVPMARFPIYSATKAAMHSFSMSLRQQLQDTSIKVFELIPPTVYDTELKGRPLEKTDWMVSSGEVAEALKSGVERNEYEIAVGPAKRWSRASRDETDSFFKEINH